MADSTRLLTDAMAALVPATPTPLLSARDLYPDWSRMEAALALLRGDNELMAAAVRLSEAGLLVPRHRPGEEAGLEPRVLACGLRDVRAGGRAAGRMLR